MTVTKLSPPCCLQPAIFSTGQSSTRGHPLEGQAVPSAVVGPRRRTLSYGRHDLDMRVLVAEDDEVLAKAVAVGLRREGMAVDIVVDGDDAVDHLAINHYDVVVLDRDLPGTHGDDICRSLVADRSTSRVLMLTAASSVKDRVDGLGLGADDYLPKPFEFAELVARIRAVGRRPATPPAVLTHEDLSLDPGRRVAFRAGRQLALTRKELAVLECLLAANGKPVSAEELLETVWDDETDLFTATVKTTISRLRAKLGDPPVIETIRESGYRIGGPR